jgi:DNA-binding IclR family transcriptional regulator
MESMSQQRKPVKQGAGAATGVQKMNAPPVLAGVKETNRDVDVQVIARAADILSALSEHPGGQSLAQIGEYTQLSRSTVHRIVVALSRKQYVRQTKTGYRLGPALLRLAEATHSSFELDVHPHLVELSRSLRETVDLSQFAGQTITFVDQVIAIRRLRAVSGIGISFPLHSTAPGKAVLAAMGPTATDRLLAEHFERFTPSTHTDRASLEVELEEIRRTGVAFDREEFTIGICAVGVALLAPYGSWYAISVPLPAQRFYGQEDRIVEALLSTMNDVIYEQGQISTVSDDSA